MRVYEDIYAENLRDHLWGQGQRNYDILVEMGADDEAIYNALLELCADGDEEKPIDETYVNDMIWHEFDTVKELVGVADWDDMPEVEFDEGLKTLRDVVNDEDEKEETREKAGRLYDVIEALRDELEESKEAKEVSSELDSLIEKAEELDEDGLFDFDDLKDFLEKVG